jgi:hypothetical protein
MSGGSGGRLLATNPKTNKTSILTPDPLRVQPP